MFLSVQHTCSTGQLPAVAGPSVSVMYNTFYSPPAIANLLIVSALCGLFCTIVFCFYAVPIGAAFLASVLLSDYSKKKI